jgi:pyruvate dehydrogenase E1 component
MFGFQRVGDLLWAAADQMTRGVLLGATAGRTTLNGEGLQHEDGHSHLLAATNPACVAYDPAWAYEISFIVEDALRRMYGEQPEDVFYYLTVYNEPVPQPAAPDGVGEGVVRGMYRFRTSPEIPSHNGDPPKVQLLASGTAIHWALAAQELLAGDWGVGADVWSVTSWSELRRDALACEHARTTPYVTSLLADAPGPVVAVSDWIRTVPDQIAPWVPGDWLSLGTDGFGRSDTREALRRYFGVDAQSVAITALRALAVRGEVKSETPEQAAAKYGYA